MSTAVATFVIAADHPCLEGHFPGQPVVPGVVILDEVIGVLEARLGPLPGLRLAQVKFVQPLLPQQEAAIHLHEVTPVRWRFSVQHAGQVMASGEMALP